MRTIIDLPEYNLSELAKLCAKEGIEVGRISRECILLSGGETTAYIALTRVEHDDGGVRCTARAQEGGDIGFTINALEGVAEPRQA